MTRKICVVTGTRAEYGLLRWIMEGIRESAGLRLQLVVTGAHLSPMHGDTYQEIEGDGFSIDIKLDVHLESDSPAGVAKSMALALSGIANALDALKPDVILVLGDRFEVFAAAAATTVARIPIAHIHGGETTEGAFDESFRHSITKMSQIHFVAAPEYAARVIQLGERPESVFVVGGAGVDAIKRIKLLDRHAVEDRLGFEFGHRNLLVTFHPATLDSDEASLQVEELLRAVDGFPETNFIFTLPNADPGSQSISRLIQRFVDTHPNARAYASLGQLLYLSCLQFVDGVVGNSSSGLLEVPSFRKGTVNIGDRQRGRLRAESVIDCKPERSSIADAIRLLYTSEFRELLARVKNPYGEGGASEKIVKILSEYPLDGILKKSFYDLPNEPKQKVR